MIIQDISLIPLQATLPRGRAYGMSKSLATARVSTLVRLRLANGVEGVGECWGLPQANLALLPLLRDALLGRHALDAEHAYATLHARHYHFGIQGPLTWCISGIDMAVKDAIGRSLGLPVHRLIGGKRLAQVPIYASGGYLTENDAGDFAPQIEAMARAGHRCVKIKIGVCPENDAARVALARRILGPDVALAVDINANYTVDVARQSIDRIAEHGIAWVEEPLAPQDIDGYERLHRTSPIALAAGEALYTVFDFKRLTERRAIDVLQPDLSLCGGFWQARQIAQLARTEHLRLSPHVWGTGVGLAAAVHFVAALPDILHTVNVPHPTLVEYDLGENPLRDGIIHGPMTPVNDLIEVPDAPGLGIEVDWAAVERHAAR